MEAKERIFKKNVRSVSERRQRWFEEKKAGKLSLDKKKKCSDFICSPPAA
jgi:hypothetical protein